MKYIYINNNLYKLLYNYYITKSLIKWNKITKLFNYYQTIV